MTEPKSKKEMAAVSVQELRQMKSSELREWLHLQHVPISTTRQNKDDLLSLALAQVQPVASKSRPMTARRRSGRNQKSSGGSDLSNHGVPLRTYSISTRSSKALVVGQHPNPNPNPKISPPLREITGSKGSNSAPPIIDHIAKNVRLAIDQTRQRGKANAASMAPNPKAKAKAKARHDDKLASPGVSKKLKVFPVMKEEEDEEEEDGDGHEGGVVVNEDGHGHGHGDGDGDGHEHGHQHGHGHEDDADEHVDMHRPEHADEHADVLRVRHANEGADAHVHGPGDDEHMDAHGHGDDGGHMDVANELVDEHGRGHGRMQRLKRSGNLIFSHVNERVLKRLKVAPSRIHAAASPRATLVLALCAIVASVGITAYLYHLKKLKEQQARSRRWW